MSHYRRFFPLPLEVDAMAKIDRKIRIDRYEAQMATYGEQIC